MATDTEKSIVVPSPFLNQENFDRRRCPSAKRHPAGDVMTLDGTFSKIILSAIILFISCIVCYVFPYLSTMAYLGCMFASVIICLVLYCRPHTAPWIAPFFPIGEGILLGIFSRFGKEDDFLGQAIFTNFAVIALILSVYRLGIIKKRNRLLSAFILVTLGVALIYIIVLT